MGARNVIPTGMRFHRLPLALVLLGFVACSRTPTGEPNDDNPLVELPSVCPVAPCTVAASDRDFGSVQGMNGWFYGHWPRYRDGDQRYVQAELELMTFHPGPSVTYERSDVWKPVGEDAECCDNGFSWTMIAADVMHPDGDPIYDVPIRRWVSNVSGRARVNIDLRKSDAGGGDGVTGELILDDETIWTGTVDGDSNVGTQTSVAVALEVGMTLDLLIGPRVSDSNDTTTTILTITD